MLTASHQHQARDRNPRIGSRGWVCEDRGRCLQHSQVFHRPLQWKLKPFFFLIKAIAMTLLLAVFCSARRFQSHSIYLSVSSFATTPLPWTRLWCLQYTLSFLLLRRFLAFPIGLVFMFNIIENSISADTQIRFINFVALESGFKVRGGEATYSTSGKVDDIFALSTNITIRTPGH